VIAITAIRRGDTYCVETRIYTDTPFANLNYSYAERVVEKKA